MLSLIQLKLFYDTFKSRIHLTLNNFQNIRECIVKRYFKTRRYIEDIERVK